MSLAKSKRGQMEHINDTLTYTQKLALDGEIAFAIATSNHDDDVIYRAYSILKVSPKEFYLHILECFQELSGLPEETFLRLRAEIALGKVPLWIWANKFISDLKECVKMNNQATNSVAVSADPKELRKKLMESAFVMYCHKTAMLCVAPIMALCEKVLEENDLEFLHMACVSLMKELSVFPVAKKVPKEVLEKVFESCFDVKDILSFKIEMETLQQNSKIVPNDAEVINLSNSKSGEMIKSLLESTTPRRKKKSTTYVVKKTFKGSGKSATLETFKTKKEAEEFVRTILEQFPDLAQTCSFSIEHQI